MYKQTGRGEFVMRKEYMAREAGLPDAELCSTAVMVREGVGPATGAR